LNKKIKRRKEKNDEIYKKLYSTDNKFMGMNSEDRTKLVSDMQVELYNIQMQRDQLKSKKESQSSYKNELDAKFSTLPQGMIKLAKLKRDVKINEELYLSVSRKYGEIAVLQQSQSGFGRIVDSGITP